MSGDLLRTKLYVPRVRPSLVPRPHLITKLNQGLNGKLTLVSAPAGFGKTTLVSEWIADCERPFAWLSLDERDSDLTRFLTYLIAAMQTIATVGERTAALLESPNLPPTDAVLTALLNEMSAVPQEMALVLDDYHVVDARPIDAALTFLLVIRADIAQLTTRRENKSRTTAKYNQPSRVGIYVMSVVHF